MKIGRKRNERKKERKKKRRKEEKRTNLILPPSPSPSPPPLLQLHHNYLPIRFSNESTLIRKPFTISPILLIFRNSFCSSSHCRSISLNVSISMVAWSTTFDARLWDACVDRKVCAESCDPGKRFISGCPSNGLHPVVFVR